MDTTTTQINIGDDIIDVRDVIERVEELRDLEERDEMEAEELRTLTGLLDELKGYGGDEQWEGDWYPLTMIHDSYFEEYARELADDIGAIDRNASWPLNNIDWKAAADDLRIDYAEVHVNGETYWYR